MGGVSLGGRSGSRWVRLPPKLFIACITTRPRVEMISRAERAISESGGWVLDHHLFSNLAVSIAFEVDARKVGALHKALRETGLVIASESESRLAELSEGAAEAGAEPPNELSGYLQITFVHDDPDLRRAVPSIPG
jgi:hypothetical protein